jgi:hypothetical protein
MSRPTHPVVSCEIPVVSSERIPMLVRSQLKTRNSRQSSRSVHREFCYDAGGIIPPGTNGATEIRCQELIASGQRIQLREGSHGYETHAE